MDVIIDEKKQITQLSKKTFWTYIHIEEKDWKKMSQNANREWDFPIFQTSCFWLKKKKTKKV